MAYTNSALAGTPDLQQFDGTDAQAAALGLVAGQRSGQWTLPDSWYLDGLNTTQHREAVPGRLVTTGDWVIRLKTSGGVVTTKLVLPNADKIVLFT
jgi:hypothetical protein